MNTMDEPMRPAGGHCVTCWSCVSPAASQYRSPPRPVRPPAIARVCVHCFPPSFVQNVRVQRQSGATFATLIRPTFVDVRTTADAGSGKMRRQWSPPSSVE